MINEWSHAKGRIEKEINRRVESANYGHRFSEVRMVERSGKDLDKKELDKVVFLRCNYDFRYKKNTTRKLIGKLMRTLI